ncbi:hypothetical protein LCGC14_1755400 [marine sediment metagenome]|uniref:Uncharacterized protein n=1 Tax=marine sediment metagenome TaxID=412755 RepID=A0A0F9K2A2_9ZZZZ
MGKIIHYKHHGLMVAVDEGLKGKHWEHCLCARCAWFVPNDDANSCPTANELFAFCVDNCMVTPVYECPYFQEEKDAVLETRKTPRTIPPD